MSPEANTTHYLLTIFGKLKPATLAEARQVHNATAGNPAGVAAARSLGDLSHMVYVPTGSDGQAAGELLILDIWNSPEGLNQFFSSHDVQAGGEMIFTEREPVLWMPATGATSYHLPAPKGKNDRFVGLVRGRVHSHEQAWPSTRNMSPNGSMGRGATATFRTTPTSAWPSPARPSR